MDHGSLNPQFQVALYQPQNQALHLATAVVKGSKGVLYGYVCVGVGGGVGV